MNQRISASEYLKITESLRSAWFFKYYETNMLISWDGKIILPMDDCFILWEDCEYCNSNKGAQMDKYGCCVNCGASPSYSKDFIYERP